MAQPYNASILKVWGLMLDVKLGYASEERENPQQIGVDIEIKFLSLPDAVKTDALDDSICYDQVIAAVRAAVANKEYSLIEHLCFEIHSVVVAMAKGNKVSVVLTKHPKVISDYFGKVSFEICS